MTISRHVIAAYKEDFGADWQLHFGLNKERLERLWADHVQCHKCGGNGFTKATVHLMPPAAMARMTADPVLAKQPIPICKTECVQCQGAGVLLASKRTDHGERGR